VPPDDKETIRGGRWWAKTVEVIRRAARADRQRKDGRWLAVLPIVVAALVLGLMMPRATEPDVVPLPMLDVRALNAVVQADDARARAAEAERLPADVLSLGTVLRELSGADGRGLDDAERADARRRLDAALSEVARHPGYAGELLALRALQLRRFLEALSRWETSGETGEDFSDFVAAFVEKMHEAGWLKDRTLLAPEHVRRVMFKTVWTAMVGLDDQPALRLTLDEQRALYTFYLEHPRVPETDRLVLESLRAAATTPEACARSTAEEQRHKELWRADKIKRLGALDPSYPVEFALGVTQFRAGRFDQAAESFGAFLAHHSSGPYTLRAKNHLKASLAATTR
jgi:hypothetical protein